MAAATAATWTGHGRVLCIDDDPQVLALLEEHFVRNGFDVDIALEGTNGLALAQAHEYHAMVVDLRLTPEMTGLGVCDLRTGWLDRRDRSSRNCVGIFDFV